MRRLGSSLSLAGLVALLLALPAAPAPMKEEKAPDGPETPAQRKASADNLKRIGMAMHVYHDSNDAFPANLKARDGKPGLSWRVAILSQLDQKALYQQFKLDEPWDSENNKKLIDKMPSVFAPVRGKSDRGHTFYQMFAGKQTLLDPDGGPVRFADVTDGLSNTLMVAEAARPVIWTRPDDIAYDGKDPPKLGGLFDSGFHAVMGDGSVHRIRKDLDPQTLRALIERADGEPVDVEGVRVKEEKDP